MRRSEYGRPAPSGDWLVESTEVPVARRPMGYDVEAAVDVHGPPINLSRWPDGS